MSNRMNDDYRRRSEQQWLESIAVDSPPSIIPKKPAVTLPNPERRIITPDEFREDASILIVDPRILQHFDKDPGLVFSLSPRQFEEFVAELLSQLGYNVKLSPQGRDGGVDVYAERENDIGSELVLVQCKRYREENKVGEPVVKQLHADVNDRLASRGLVVTSSTFTRPAIDYIERFRYRMAGADFANLKQWTAEIVRSWSAVRNIENA